MITITITINGDPVDLSVDEARRVYQELDSLVHGDDASNGGRQRTFKQVCAAENLVRVEGGYMNKEFVNGYV